jgi:hypothetical protein
MLTYPDSFHIRSDRLLTASLTSKTGSEWLSVNPAAKLRIFGFSRAIVMTLAIAEGTRFWPSFEYETFRLEEPIMRGEDIIRKF